MKYPEAEQAWLFGDHEVFRVKQKVFIWVSDGDDGQYGIGVKLRDTQAAALALPFVSPMAYGMAQRGRVNASFKKSQKAPLSLLLEWVEESYRHTAPKRLIAQLDGRAPAPSKSPPKKKPARRPESASKRRARG